MKRAQASVLRDVEAEVHSRSPLSVPAPVASSLLSSMNGRRNVTVEDMNGLSHVEKPRSRGRFTVAQTVVFAMLASAASFLCSMAFYDSTASWKMRAVRGFADAENGSPGLLLDPPIAPASFTWRRSSAPYVPLRPCSQMNDSSFDDGVQLLGTPPDIRSDYSNYRLAECELVLANTPPPRSSTYLDEPWPSMDIILPVVAKDAGLVVWFLRSVELLFPNYRRVRMLVERRDLYAVLGILPTTQGRYSVILVNNPFRRLEEATGADYGYVVQQLYKMHSDLYSDADFVTILESDLVLRARVQPQHFFRNVSGVMKPIILIKPYSDRIQACEPGRDIWKDCEATIWKAGMEYAMNGRDPKTDDTNATYLFTEYEFMQGNPFTYPRDFFPYFRQRIKAIHGKTIPEFLEHYFEGTHWHLDGKSDKLSEFNIFGFFLWTSPEFHDEMSWIIHKNYSPWNNDGWPDITDHFSRFRSDCNPANPKVTYAYIMSAVMEIHKRFCKTVQPEHALCQLSPPNSLRTEYDRLEEEKQRRIQAEREKGTR